MPSILSFLTSCRSSVQPDGPALPRPLPGLLTDPLARQQLRAAWKGYLACFARTPGANLKGPSARDMAVYALLLGKPLTRVFSPVSSPAKLANGMRAFARVREVFRGLEAPPHQIALHGLLERLQLEVVKVPSAKSGGGTRLSYEYFVLRQPLLDAAGAVTEHTLETAYALQTGASK